MNNKVEIKNRKASFEYEFIDTLDAGIVLVGSEIKSIRDGNVSISEAYCRFIDNELFIVGMHIAEYKHSRNGAHEPYRIRKLLLKRQEINKFQKKVNQKGLTIIPVKLFTKKGNAKIKIALARGKKEYDKRADIKEKDNKRDLNRDLKKY